MLSDAEYRAALAEASTLIAQDPEPDSPAGQRLTALTDTLIEYERVNFPHLFRLPWHFRVSRFLRRQVGRS